MKDTLVSVIVPIYNGTKTLQRCVESLKAQSLKECEFIFVDDGSTDDTVENFYKLTSKDNRFVILQMGKRTDPFQARKQGILAANGKYIMFLDADDTFIPKACERAYKTISRKNVDLFLFGSRPIKTGTISKQTLKGYRRYLRFENKIKGLYPTKELCQKLFFNETSFGFANSLAKKIFKTDILKQVIVKLAPEQYLGYGQDLYQLIATMPKISSIYANNKIVLHNYFLGDGVSQLGYTAMPIEKFSRIISSANTYSAIQSFLQSADLSEGRKQIALKHAKKSLLTSAQRHLWYLNDTDLPQGFVMLKNAWGSSYLDNMPINDNIARVNEFILNNSSICENIKTEIKNFLIDHSTNFNSKSISTTEQHPKALARLISPLKWVNRFFLKHCEGNKQ